MRAGRLDPTQFVRRRVGAEEADSLNPSPARVLHPSNPFSQSLPVTTLDQAVGTALPVSGCAPPGFVGRARANLLGNLAWIEPWAVGAAGDMG